MLEGSQYITDKNFQYRGKNETNSLSKIPRAMCTTAIVSASSSVARGATGDAGHIGRHRPPASGPTPKGPPEVRQAGAEKLRYMRECTPKGQVSNCV